MATTKRRIQSKDITVRTEELVAAEAGIYPGMLIELNSSGYVKKHATAGGRAEILIAMEDVLQGNTVATVYTSGGIVTCLLPKKGDEVNILIEAGQDIAIGDELISAGNGTFKKASDLESGESLSQVLFKAVEACDLTASGAANTLCSARVM